MNLWDRGCEYEHIDPDHDDDRILKTGRGILHTVVLNTPNSALQLLYLYDGVNATGNLIGVVCLYTMAAGAAATFPFTHIYDAKFKTGLFIAFSGGLAAGASVTVTYV